MFPKIYRPVLAGLGIRTNMGLRLRYFHAPGRLSIYRGDLLA